MVMSAQDKKWQRESDAHTLAEAESIKSSPTRLKGAKTEAKSMAKRVEKQVKSLNKVAKVAKSAPKKVSSSRSKSGARVQSNTKLPGIKKRR